MKWLDIPGFTGYQVSDHGHVRNARGKIIKQRIASNGSLRVDLGKATALVHNLVLRAFTGHSLTTGYRPKHQNGDLSDNRLDNLMWSGQGSMKFIWSGRSPDSSHLRVVASPPGGH